MNKRLFGILVLLIAVFIVIFMLFIIRFIGHMELDDVSSGIECSDDLLEKSDVLWVIPIFNNESIALDKVWCDKILSLNKTLGLHGVYHSYREFEVDRGEDYIDRGIGDFEKCFSFKPKFFKAPQLALNVNNRNVIKGEGLIVKGRANQILHKVYHCSDSGKFSNGFIDWF